MEKEKILIVEDEIIIARDTQSRLKKMGYTITGIAESREEALASIESARPDLILMDIKIKGPVDGITSAIEFWERFKIPVVFQTAFADEITLARARVTDFYGYLVKPINENDFKIAVDNALYKAHGVRSMSLFADYFLSVLESMQTGIITADNDGLIIYMNGKARSWLEISEEPKGLNISEVFSKEGEPETENGRMLDKTVQINLKKGKKIRVTYSVGNITWKNENTGILIQFIPC
jgi:CheY-like chemotaxis protein